MKIMDINLQFKCENFLKEQTISGNTNIKQSKVGLLFTNESFSLNSNFDLKLKHGSTNIISIKSRIPFNPDGLMENIADIYSKTDKLLNNIPFVGRTLEKIMPDAYANFDLWYSMSINRDELLEYKIHFGFPGIHNRKLKFKDTIQL